MNPAQDFPVIWELRISGIHGTGVYALAKIKTGEIILEYKGEKITKAEALRRGIARESATETNGAARVFLFELNKRFDLDGDVPDNPAKFINHSCDENCEVVHTRGHLWITALRDIAAGEELSFNYGFPVENFLDHKCRCGTKNCVGYIVARHSRMKLRQLLARSRKKPAARST